MNKLAAAIADIPIPSRLLKLPISEKGFPIPEFVAWVDGTRARYLPRGTLGAIRDFRIVDPAYMAKCFALSRCWICNEPLGRHRIFAIGPMCTVTRTTMEPPSHRECVEYAAKACPFLSRPKMVRNDKGLPEGFSAPGIPIDRNPGVTALWETQNYSRFRAPGGVLCEIGDPDKVDWWAEGRPASRAEVLASIDSGMPLLMSQAIKDGPEGVKDLNARLASVAKYLPVETEAT